MTKSEDIHTQPNGKMTDHRMHMIYINICISILFLYNIECDMIFIYVFKSCCDMLGYIFHKNPSFELQGSGSPSIRWTGIGSLEMTRIGNISGIGNGFLDYFINR